MPPLEKELPPTGSAARAEIAAGLPEALSAPHWLDRRYAAIYLERLGPDGAPAVPALIRALEDDDLGVRMRAALCLGAIGAAAAAAVPALEVPIRCDLSPRDIVTAPPSGERL